MAVTSKYFPKKFNNIYLPYLNEDLESFCKALEVYVNERTEENKSLLSRSEKCLDSSLKYAISRCEISRDFKDNLYEHIGLLYVKELLG